MLTLSDAAQAMQGILTGKDTVFTKVVSDSRMIANHDLFFALEGEKHDGHLFAEEALKKGAAGIVAHKALGLGEIIVEDTRKALLSLAAFWRNRFTLPIVAVTGSCGKTTVKEMIAHLLSGKVHKTPGNLNNDIGLPLSVLGLRKEHERAVFEIGMNHAGEIALLAAILQPDIGVITNIHPAHLQGLGSVEAIAMEKASLLAHLSPTGIAVLNADDAFFSFFAKKAKGKTIISAGFTEHADVRGYLENQTLWAKALGQEWLVAENIMGRHEAQNMLLSLAAMLVLGDKPIALPFAAWQGVAQRLTRRQGKHGSLILDDSYNANPGSLAAAIDVLASCPGKKILILGDMGELGDAAPFWHRWAGEYARQSHIDILWTVGELAKLAQETFSGASDHFPTIEAMMPEIEALADERSTILVKASRAMRFERVTQALEETPCS